MYILETFFSTLKIFIYLFIFILAMQVNPSKLIWRLRVILAANATWTMCNRYVERMDWLIFRPVMLDVPILELTVTILQIVLVSISVILFMNKWLEKENEFKKY